CAAYVVSGKRATAPAPAAGVAAASFAACASSVETLTPGLAAVGIAQGCMASGRAVALLETGRVASGLLARGATARVASRDVTNANGAFGFIAVWRQASQLSQSQ